MKYILRMWKLSFRSMFQMILVMTARIMRKPWAGMTSRNKCSKSLTPNSNQKRRVGKHARSKSNTNSRGYCIHHTCPWTDSDGMKYVYWEYLFSFFYIGIYLLNVSAFCHNKESVFIHVYFLMFYFKTVIRYNLCVALSRDNAVMGLWN